MSKCDKCDAGKYQDFEGKTECDECLPGSYCAEGAATPIPCPAGTFGNASALVAAANCSAVRAGYWAPLGSRLPEPCPSSGFYCPGTDADTVNDIPGSKPIISPVGGVSTDAVTTELTLDLDPADFPAAEEAMRVRLAQMYGVDPSMIDLAPSAGSLVLVVTIKPPADGSGSTAPFDAAAITAQVDATSAASLSATLGVNVSQVAPPQVTVVSAVCPPGYWCTAGDQVACLRGFYNPNRGANNQTSCLGCPARATTILEASTTPLSCVCTAGYFKVDTADGTAGMQCESCDSTWKLAPDGTACSRVGATLEALPLSAGFWWQSNVSKTVRPCFTPSACVGGENASSQCAPSQLEGSAYCAVCAADHYGGGDGKLCTPCSGSTVLTFLPTIVLVAAALLALASACLCGRIGLERVKRSKLFRVVTGVHGRVAGWLDVASVKLRILISLVQILKGVSVSFAIPYPDFYLRFLSWMSLIEFNLPDAMPMGCFFPVQYYHRIAIMTAVPLCLLLVLAWLTRTFRGSKSHAWIGDRSDTALALLLFILYPSVSTSLFSYFICDKLDGSGEDGVQLLRVDYSITCGSADYTAFQPYTLFMIMVFPIGTPALYLVLMVMHRSQLARIQRAETRVEARHEIAVVSRLSVHQRATMSDADIAAAAEEAAAAEATQLRSELTGVLRKVTEGYKMRCYWFEIFECVRKLLLVGVPVFLPPGSNGQLLTGLVVSFLTTGVYAKFEPYEDPMDGRLQLVCQFEIFIALLSSLVLQVDPSNPVMGFLLPAMLLVPPVYALWASLVESDLLRRWRRKTAGKRGDSIGVVRGGGDGGDGRDSAIGAMGGWGRSAEGAALDDIGAAWAEHEWDDIQPAVLPEPSIRWLEPPARPGSAQGAKRCSRNISNAAKLSRNSRIESQPAGAPAAGAARPRGARSCFTKISNSAKLGRKSRLESQPSEEAPPVAPDLGSPGTGGTSSTVSVAGCAQRTAEGAPRTFRSARPDARSVPMSNSRQSHLEDEAVYSCEKPITSRRRTVEPGSRLAPRPSMLATLRDGSGPEGSYTRPAPSRRRSIETKPATTRRRSVEINMPAARPAGTGGGERPSLRSVLSHRPRRAPDGTSSVGSASVIADRAPETPQRISGHPTRPSRAAADHMEPSPAPMGLGGGHGSAASSGGATQALEGAVERYSILHQPGGKVKVRV